MPDGLLVVYKPVGCSSHDVIAKIRRTYKVKCGHAGTLDPMAQGVLLVFMNRALKLLHFLTAEYLDKTYLMRVTLGTNTDSYDATGKITSKFSGPVDFSNEELMGAIRNFVGTYNQTPPAFSAIKVGGKRAYSLARAGEEVKLKSRKVHVTSIRLVSDLMLAEQRNLIMRVHCSRGTYIRSIAYDLGQKLGCGGHLSYLLRERVGKWAFTEAFPYWKIEKGMDFANSASFIDFDEILPFPKLQITPESAAKVKNGLPLGVKDIGKIEGEPLYENPSGLVQVFSSAKKLIAIYERSKKPAKIPGATPRLSPVRVFPENEA
jgi:tRNA pseudouridine55 synthase